MPSPSPLPPLNAVEAFVLIARVGSFSEAAGHLGTSVSTLSRRVKTLEAHLGEKLFDRGKAGVRLTPAGEAYLKAADQALETLAMGRDLARFAEKAAVKVTLPQFFITKFFADRLAEFDEKNPDITLVFDTTPYELDLTQGDYDLAIRFGMAGWPGLVTEQIYVAVGGPACGPKLANGLELPRRVEALRNHTLLHVSEVARQWDRFFEEAGCKGLKGANDRYYDNAELLYAAACQGLGIALCDRVLSADLLDAGLLVCPIDIEVATGEGFHFVYAPGREDRPAVRRFCDWVLSLDQVQAFRERQKAFGY